MSIAMYAAGGALLGAALYATYVYFCAVHKGHRAYLHVSLASVFTVAVSFLLIRASADESGLWQAASVVAHLVGIAAMLNLAGRFRGGGEC